MQSLSLYAAEIVEVVRPFLTPIFWTLMGFGLFQNGVYLLQLPFAWLELVRRTSVDDTESAWHQLVSNETMPISVIVPAYNEGVGIASNVTSVLSLRYPDMEVIVVNDGSTDDTLDVLKRAFDLKPIDRACGNAVFHQPVKQVYAAPNHPNLFVIDKVNGKGKADASNAGINYARSELFCIMDADSFLDADALLSCVRPFIEDPTMIAVGGTIRVLNGCTVKSGQVTELRLPTNFLALVQCVEYIRSFLIGRLAWSHLGMLGIISGGFGIFKRRIAIEAGGFNASSIGEDYELVMHMHKMMRQQKRPYAMRYAPEPVCWTEAPSDYKTLASQRKRWQRGAVEVFFRHSDMLLNPRYGRIGMVLMPINFITDVIGPIAELVGYALLPIMWITGSLNYNFMFAFVAVFFLLGINLTICTLILEEAAISRSTRTRDVLQLALIAVVENFGYRQVNTYWRIIGWWEYATGKKSWGNMIRKGAAAYQAQA